MNVYGRSLAFPPRVGTDGRLLWSEGEDNVRQSIILILKTEPGERVALANFGAGLSRFLFEPNNAATHVRIADAINRALALWEGRIRVEAVDVEADPSLFSAATATIVYRLVATGARERISLTIPVAAP